MTRYLWILVLLFVLASTTLAQGIVTCGSVDYAAVIDEQTLLLNTMELRPGFERMVAGLRIFDVKTQSSKLITDPVNQYPTNPVVSPDGQQVAFFPNEYASETSVRVYDIATGETHDLVTDAYGVPLELQWSPTSDRLYVAVMLYRPNTHVGVYEYDLDAGTWRNIIVAAVNEIVSDEHIAEYTTMAVSNKGLIALSVPTPGFSGNTLLVVDPANLSLVTDWYTGLTIYRMSWTPDGAELLVENGGDGRWAEMWVFDPVNHSAIFTGGLNQYMVYADWSPSVPDLLVLIVPSKTQNQKFLIKALDLAHGTASQTEIGWYTSWFWYDAQSIGVIMGDEINIVNVLTHDITALADSVCG